VSEEGMKLPRTGAKELEFIGLGELQLWKGEKEVQFFHSSALKG